MNKRDTQLELVRRCLDGEADQKELIQLEDLLREDPEFRKEYLRYLNVDSGLAELPKSESQPVSSSKPLPFPKWRPLATSAAAGLVFGLCCASVAWAIVVPKAIMPVVLPVLSESFESTSTPLIDGFPSGTGEWGGDRARIVEGGPDHKPMDGGAVLSLESSPDSNLGFIQQIIDVSPLPKAGEGEMRVLEVISSFHADQPGEMERYTLRIATFDEAPGEIRHLWESVPWSDMDKVSLTLSKTGLSTPKDAEGWQTLSAIVEVPANARSVVVSLAAGRLDKKAPKTPHYVDDVRAEFRIIPFVERLRPKKK